MKLQSEKRDLITGGLGQTQAFQIRASGKAFRILSDGLYSDKPLAVVRELSCNAWDSHVAAGTTETPFEIHLPNLLEPWFSVKDYGLGLAHDDVMNLYTTYFDSTKTDSNDMIGALGLGSKSPFSYVDQFTVESRFNGTKSIYSAYISDDDIPCISLVAHNQTSEPNGLTIQLPAKETDFKVFENKVAEFFTRWSKKPKVTGINTFKFDEIKYILEGKNWKVRDTKDFWNSKYKHNLLTTSTKVFAIQGNVAYPIQNVDILTDEDAKVICNLPVDIMFNIGELDVQASREGLSYKKETKENIKIKLYQVYNEINKELEKELKNCKSFWDANVKFNQLNQYDNVLQILGIKHITWRGKDIDGYLRIPSEDIKLRSIRRGYHTNKKTFNYLRDGDICCSIIASEDQKFLINDLKEGKESFQLSKKIQIYFKELSRNCIVIIDYTDKKHLDLFLQEWGNPPANLFIKTSSLPEVPKVKRETKIRNTKLFELNKVYSSNSNSWGSQKVWSIDWKETTVDVTCGGTYILMNQWKPVKDGVRVTDLDHRFDNYLKQAKDLELISGPIYGVPGTFAKKFLAEKDKYGWKEFYSLTSEKIKAIIDLDIQEIISNIFHNHIRMGEPRILEHTLETLNKILSTPKVKPSLLKLLGEYVKYKQGAPNNIKNKLDFFRNTLESEDSYTKFVQSIYDITKLKEMCKNVLDDYPLLNFVDSSIPNDILINHVLKEN
jgi:hypothetical protein